MTFRIPRRWGLFLLLLTVTSVLPGQENRQSQRRALLEHVGEEVLVLDITSGERQFTGADAGSSFRVTLVAVMRDHLVVARNVEGDKRAFIYPLTVVRRLVTMSENRPLRPIVIEMY